MLIRTLSGGGPIPLTISRMLTGAGCRIEALQSRERATGQRQHCGAPHAPHQRVRLSGHPRRLGVFHGSRPDRSAPPKCKDHAPGASNVRWLDLVVGLGYAWASGHPPQRGHRNALFAQATFQGVSW